MISVETPEPKTAIRKSARRIPGNEKSTSSSRPIAPSTHLPPSPAVTPSAVASASPTVVAPTPISTDSRAP